MPLTEINPITAALQLMRECKYQEAADLLYAEFDKNPRQFHMARVANLIHPSGMIPEAIDALHRMSSNIQEYQANPPADEDIGCVVSVPNRTKVYA